MLGDPKYTWVLGGSVAASANTPHSVFAGVGSLSSMNTAEVVNIQFLASKNNTRLWPSLANANLGAGFRLVSGNDYYVDMPPMGVGEASQLHFTNETAGQNGELRFIVWRRSG